MSKNPMFPAFGWNRRQMLRGILAYSAIQVTPGFINAATTAALPASASPAFTALSRYLTERSDLNAGLAARMQAALQAQNADFAAQTDALWQWIDSGKIALAALNERLKAEKPELAGVPGQVMQAWYLGIVGSGTKARAVAYEYALNAQTVSDKLRPPTYSYGMYGSWTSNPTTFDLKLQPVHA